MIDGIQDHIDDLLRHITLVRDACTLLGKRLIKDGREPFGVGLITRGHTHDISKFRGIEWDYLHIGPKVAKTKLEYARRQHTATNDHHPEFWPDGINSMSELAVAEMVCDWYARAQERATDLRAWIDSEAIKKFGLDKKGEVYKCITNFVDILLESSFKPMDDKS